MAVVLFTPAFEGDEYHNISVHFHQAGEQEVDERMAEYLTQTFSNRFKRVAAKVLAQDDEAPKPAKKGSK